MSEGPTKPAIISRDSLVPAGILITVLVAFGAYIINGFERRFTSLEDKVDTLIADVGELKGEKNITVSSR